MVALRSSRESGAGSGLPVVVLVPVGEGAPPDTGGSPNSAPSRASVPAVRSPYGLYAGGGGAFPVWGTRLPVLPYSQEETAELATLESVSCSCCSMEA